MAINNRDRVGKAFDFLSEGLFDVIDEVMTGIYQSQEWNTTWASQDAQKFGSPEKIYTKHDVQVQLRAITENKYTFKDYLSHAQQGFASELRDARNNWAHNEPFSSDDAIRALDTMERLLVAVGSTGSAEDIRKLRVDLQRSVFEEQTRSKVKKARLVLDADNNGLKPWREVIQPHEDVAKGQFTASEFAADLHLVNTGQATSPEYGDPVEFFSRTYITEGLEDLLSRALRRMNGDKNASPVVNLQTNFGGGKTHSMLALYHLFGGTPAKNFPQEVQELIEKNGAPKLEGLGVRRVALVGTYLQAGSPAVKDDGTEVNTLWGELAWQLGGREAYQLIETADKAGTNPGESLRVLLEKYSPSLILIDEWVAYARQLVTEKTLPAGSFETQFTFAQSLTEIIRSIQGAILVVSIPASDSREDGQGADIEVGGTHGQLALDRLQNVIRRVADQWRPSSKDESFEIVRRRLFLPPDADGLTTIAAVARSFANLYRNNSSLFPRDATTTSDDYEKRIRGSYPLHPELLDRLYEDWSTLERFQRTRGVLKLVSSIVHELWASGDSAPMILPGNVPLDATRVNTDLAQYLEDQWKPIIDSDIDGDGATAIQIDLDRPNLGQRSVTRRIARTIFMGAAPRLKSARKGLDKQYVWLGTAIPGDALGNFGSALEQLSQRSTYFYEEQGHYWFDTRPSVTKTANDYANRLREDDETVWNEIALRLRSEESPRGSFDRVHIAPESSSDVPDLEDTRLVIAHPRYSRIKNVDETAAWHKWVRDVIENKGASQRIHRNTLVFLLPEKTATESLEAATRTYLGWKQVQVAADSLNLSNQQQKQTEEAVARFDKTVQDRLRDAYGWAVYPEQIDPTKNFELFAVKVPESGNKNLAERVSAKLQRDDQLITSYGPANLGDEVLSRLLGKSMESGHISVGELWGYFTRYPYMPRLTHREVLDEAIGAALTETLIENERFAIASIWDEENKRYRGLILPPDVNSSIQVTDSTLLVRWDIAEQQAVADKLAREAQQTSVAFAESDSGAETAFSSDGTMEDFNPRVDVHQISEEEKLVSRFFGSVSVNPHRYGQEFTVISREVLDQLIGSGADVEITIDIQATKQTGFNEGQIRTIRENTRTLKFDPNSGFEIT